MGTPDKVFNLLGAIVVVALVTTLVSHKGTARVVGSLGSAFAGSLRAAQGRQIMGLLAMHGVQYPAPFVERREPEYEGMTFMPERHSVAAAHERFVADSGGAHEPVTYSDFRGGRGRPVEPSAQDVIAYFNPATALGGMGSSFQEDFMQAGKAAMPSNMLAVNRSRSINRPRTNGVLPWAVRTNTYRPPSQSYSEASDTVEGIDTFAHTTGGD